MTNWLSHKDKIVLCVVSFVFIVINLLTFDHLLPWNDEVELTETILNYIDFGQWTSKAYPEYGGCTPFSMYVPLPQFLQTAWMFLFGTSMYAARSFNLVVVLCIGFVCLALLRKLLNRPLSLFGSTLFSCLLWGCSEFADIYRNGRGDIVGVLICLLLALYAYEYIRNITQKDLLIVSLFAATLTWCALQACVLVVFGWIFFFVLYRNYRKSILKLGVYLLLGFVVGFITVVGYFAYNHHFMAFVHTILGLSGTLKMLAVKALPLVGPFVGLDPDVWAAKVADDAIGDSPSFLMNLVDITRFVAYDIIIALSVIVLYFTYKENLKAIKRDYAFVILIFGIFVPLAMTLAGRYVPYYWWMSYVPVLLSVLLLVENNASKVVQIVYAFVSIGIIAIGVTNMYDIESKAKYDEWKALCGRLPIEKTDIVSCPDFTLYEIRQHSDNCYFTKHYELKNINLDELDYYLQYGPDINTTRNTKKSIEFDNAVKNDTTIQLVLIERNELLDLNVYKVDHLAKE